MMEERIDSLIYDIRDVQVMLDSDLAALFDVETKVFNQAVKRNINRFPNGFRFQLSEIEYAEIKDTENKSDNKALRSQFVTFNNKANNNDIGTTYNEVIRTQNVTLENKRGKHRKYLPYVFTEQGVAMLTGVIRSDIAIEMSIKIMNAFVEMRRIISSSALLSHRVDFLENRQLDYQKESDEKFNQLFDALQGEVKVQKENIFFAGQIYDAYGFVIQLIKKAKTDIILIDNYVDNSVLDMISKKQNNVNVRIITQAKTKLLKTDIVKFNSQYPILSLEFSTLMHDRFLIIDRKELYHIGASLKDLGKKIFAFSLMDDPEILTNLMKRI